MIDTGALATVLHVCLRQHAASRSTIPVRTVTEALATSLYAMFRRWMTTSRTRPRTHALRKEAH